MLRRPGHSPIGKECDIPQASGPRLYQQTRIREFFAQTSNISEDACHKFVRDVLFAQLHSHTKVSADVKPSLYQGSLAMGDFKTTAGIYDSSSSLSIACAEAPFRKSIVKLLQL